MGKSNSFLKTKFYHGIASKNIFTSSDPAFHARIRKLFSPSFSPGCLQAHGEVIHGCISRLNEAIREKVMVNDLFDLNNLLYCHSVDVTSEVLLGKPLGCLQRGLSHSNLKWWNPVSKRMLTCRGN
jgi:cytochrome P450